MDCGGVLRIEVKLWRIIVCRGIGEGECFRFGFGFGVVEVVVDL